MFAFLVFAWVFALFGVGVFAWGGGTLCVPPPLALAVLWWAGFLVLTLWCGREKRVGEREGVLAWGGTWLSRPLALLGGAVPASCVRVEEKERVRVLPGVVNTRTHREMVGEPPAGQVLGWLGAGCVSGASALVAGTIPRWREREVGIASSRGGVLGWLPSGRLLAWAGLVAVLVVALLPLGARRGAGGGLRVSPFGGGLGWW